MHSCLGAHFARIERTEALHVITQRMRNLHSKPAPWKAMTGIVGPINVPSNSTPSH